MYCEIHDIIYNKATLTINVTCLIWFLYLVVIIDKLKMFYRIWLFVKHLDKIMIVTDTNEITEFNTV